MQMIIIQSVFKIIGTEAVSTKTILNANFLKLSARYLSTGRSTTETPILQWCEDTRMYFFNVLHVLEFVQRDDFSLANEIKSHGVSV